MYIHVHCTWYIHNLLMLLSVITPKLALKDWRANLSNVVNRLVPLVPVLFFVDPEFWLLLIASKSLTTPTRAYTTENLAKYLHTRSHFYKLPQRFANTHIYWNNTYVHYKDLQHQRLHKHCSNIWGLWVTRVCAYARGSWYKLATLLPLCDLVDTLLGHCPWSDITKPLDCSSGFQLWVYYIIHVLTSVNSGEAVCPLWISWLTIFSSSLTTSSISTSSLFKRSVTLPREGSTIVTKMKLWPVNKVTNSSSANLSRATWQHEISKHSKREGAMTTCFAQDVYSSTHPGMTVYLHV